MIVEGAAVAMSAAFITFIWGGASSARAIQLRHPSGEFAKSQKAMPEQPQQAISYGELSDFNSSSLAC